MKFMDWNVIIFLRTNGFSAALLLIYWANHVDYYTMLKAEKDGISRALTSYLQREPWLRTYSD